MKWLPLALMALTKIPFEKMFVRRKSVDEQIERLDQLLKSSSPIPPPSSSKLADTEAPSYPRVTREETILYQKRELAKELLLLEKHLQQKCKIGGKACDCCEKHPLVIEGLAQETWGMTGDAVYNDVIEWARLIAPITTEEASASRLYDEEYPQMAIKARELRKRIMGTTKIMPLLDEQMTTKVQKQIKEILDRTMETKEGSDERPREETV